MTYTSARERLLTLAGFGPFFEGRHAMQLFGWAPKTAAHYLWLWQKQGLVKPLGGKSDVFFNRVADSNAESHIESAIRRVMPGAVMGALNVLNESGVTTQRPGAIHLLVRSDERQFKIGGATLQSRPDSWWSTLWLHGGIVLGSEQVLARLGAGAAVADSALSRDGLDPDDIDFDALKPVERKRAARLLKALSGQAALATALEEAYVQVWHSHRQPNQDRRRTSNMRRAK